MGHELKGWAKLLAERVYRLGDNIPWDLHVAYEIKPRVRVKMGRA